MTAPDAPRWSRSTWVRLPVALVLFAIVFVGVDAASLAAADTPVLALVVGPVGAGIAVLGYVGLVRWLERRAVTELDGPVARRLLVGVLMGVILLATTIGLIAAFGGYRVSGVGSAGGALAIFGVMTAASTVEELLFRGIVFRLVEEFAGTLGALVVSGVMFGVLHLVNPAATGWGAVAIAAEAGLMLGAAYAATRSLWSVIGIHLGWNFAEAGIFGATVSGSDHGSPAGLLTATMPGPAALTGGTFGPEASLLAIGVCLVPTVLFLLAARRRGRLYPHGYRRRAIGSPAVAGSDR